MDPDSPEFLDRFAALRQRARRQRGRHEFAHLVRVADHGKLENLARTVQAARTRDAVRKAMG
jgi:hypothetical protein